MGLVTMNASDGREARPTEGLVGVDGILLTAGAGELAANLSIPSTGGNASAGDSASLEFPNDRQPDD